MRNDAALEMINYFLDKHSLHSGYEIRGGRPSVSADELLLLFAIPEVVPMTPMNIWGESLRVLLFPLDQQYSPITVTQKLRSTFIQRQWIQKADNTYRPSYVRTPLGTLQLDLFFAEICLYEANAGLKMRRPNFGRIQFLSWYVLNYLQSISIGFRSRVSKNEIGQLAQSYADRLPFTGKHFSGTTTKFLDKNNFSLSSMFTLQKNIYLKFNPAVEVINKYYQWVSAFTGGASVMSNLQMEAIAAMFDKCSSIIKEQSEENSTWINTIATKATHGLERKE